MKIYFSLQKTSMIVVVHYIVWIKFVQKLQLILIICKKLLHKKVNKFQNMWVKHIHLAYIIQHCLWSRVVANTFERQNMDSSMLRYWPLANNGKVYTMFGGMCVLVTNIPLQEGE
jgi:hypothetical protein